VAGRRPPASNWRRGHALRGSPISWARPAEIVEKILFQHEIFGHQRLLLQLGVGAIEHKQVMRAIELLGTRSCPRGAPGDRTAAGGFIAGRYLPDVDYPARLYFAQRQTPRIVPI
jgi:hypothetical protein